MFTTSAKGSLEQHGRNRTASTSGRRVSIMNVLLAVLLCLSSAAVLADEFYPGGHHGTTVCIEIRPSPHANPTKVCGPVVHGGPQPGGSGRPEQKSADPMVFNLPPAQHSEESDESREAAAPCTRPKSMMPFQMRQAEPGQGQPPPHPQAMMQRMDMPPESMPPPMMGMELDGWRQAGSPPCAHNQRTMGYPVGPMMPPPMMGRQPMANSRTWMVNPQAMMMRAAEEQAMGMAMGMRAAEEKPPGQPPTKKKESLETLLKECEEKTKLLQEKEAKITELKTQMSNKKEDDPTNKE